MTQNRRAIVASGWVASVVATISLAACDGGPATTSTTASSQSTPVTSSSDPPAASTATLSWRAPDQNTNGSALTNLAGYRIYYGTGTNALNQVIDVPTVGVTDYVIDNLAAGTYYFSIRAYTSAGVESGLSNIVSKTIG
jgi:hypothetical protein